jgi:type I restriction enzyme R subunit
MTFTESNTVESMLIDLLSGRPPTAGPLTRDGQAPYVTAGRSRRGVGWHYVAPAFLPRQPQDVMIEDYVRAALIRLNPGIAAQPERADEVIHRLRAIVLAVRADGLIRANEEFTAWLRGDRSMPFGPNHEHVTVRLIDFADLDANQYVATTQLTFRAGPAERRVDIALFVNGFPLVIVEAKTPVRAAVSWFDGAKQIHDDYERFTPELFAPNVFCVASEGKELRYGAIQMPLELWGPWRAGKEVQLLGEVELLGEGERERQKKKFNFSEKVELLDEGERGREKQKFNFSEKVELLPLGAVQRAAAALLRPNVVLDLLAHFTLFATDKKKRRMKVVARYQQYEAVNLIVQRVLAGKPRKGLIWHFQGSGKSLLMVFAAQKLRMQAALATPPCIIVVDRIDLDAQISSTFHASDVPNLVKAETREDLQRLLKQDTRKIIITTIFKFGEADGVLNDRGNIVALVDEAHRTQEGDLGIKMRAALAQRLPLRSHRHAHQPPRPQHLLRLRRGRGRRGYMSRYGFEESIRDGATLKLHFEPRLVDLHIDKAAIDQAYQALTGELSDLDKDNLAKAASKMAVLVKVPERVQKICEDIARHYQEGRAQRLQGHGRHVRPGVLPALQGRARQAPAAEATELSSRPRATTSASSPTRAPRRRGEAPRPLPRSQRPAASCSSSRPSC